MSIQRLQKELQNRSDKQLGMQFKALSENKIKDNNSDSLNHTTLVESFALMSESLRRTLGMLAYDVQLLGGLAMARGCIAEMQTGEGKTLTTAFPIATHALARQGVHVATVNAYLAERDFEFLQPALQLLGLSAGLSRPDDDTPEKRRAYECDVTFATGYELGFDFLRDQIAGRSRTDQRLGAKLKQKLFAEGQNAPVTAQRGFAAAIIDEIDSVLIDEATTPLVLGSGPTCSSEDPRPYLLAQNVAQLLHEDEDYQIIDKSNQLIISPAGLKRLETLRQQTIQNDQVFSSPKLVLLRPWSCYVDAALRAEHVMVRDVNYVVRNDKIEIVDEYTGRIFEDRSWRDGLHQAVETKEGVTLSPERRTIAKISRQRYFQRYDVLCGMTGTADGHQNEFDSVYELPIVLIPRRKPLIRKELPTRYFSSLAEKCSAIVSDIEKRHALKQPVLLGTRTIEQSQALSTMLVDADVKHRVLNGLQDEEESELIATAGTASTVTVATNMAGRGTDIQLDPISLSAGGLHVIGFERNSSLRIDRQLLGRSGRQGDPGSGQFFVSADDLLIQRHSPGLARRLRRIDDPHGESKDEYDRAVQTIQKSIEADSEKMRANVMREELWLDRVKRAAG